ncbi:integrase catalytic subunit [Caballeronia humi]|uniref:Integrase catalytic subunit n=1 Tax=Caballeronia humi TaxID=326474 RepID=A0A158JGT1_9BURK|nr:integrase catalytic subunit [Caballeronia humi]
MARILGRSPATVSRELTRNSSPAGYASVPAEALSAACRSAGRRSAKLCLQSVCWRVVLTLLEWKWSPQQISGTLKRMYPTDPTQHVSHETIYTAIYAQPRGELRRQLIACLRHGHSARMSRTRGTDRRGQIPDMVSIHVRPPEIEDRLLPGHWEGDFIKGAANQSSVGVLLERSSRLVLLAKMEDATAASALAGFSAKPTRLPRRCEKPLPTTKAKKCRGTKNSLQPLACASTSATHTALGSAGPAKTPTDCFVNICLKAPTCRYTVKTNSTPSPTA